jgi:hypothetical protein
MLLFIYIVIELKIIIKEPPSLNLVDSSFEHLLHAYDIHLVSTYKYEIGIFYFILYLIYWIPIYHFLN